MNLPGTILLTGLLLLLTASSTFPAAQDSAKGGTLVYARGTDAVNLDPSQATDTESAKVIHQIFDNLVTQDAKSPAILPGLASSWQISPDGLEYVFTLRSGVRFHDGTTLDARAAAFSLSRLLRNPECPRSPYYDYIKSVSPLETHKLKIILNHPNSDLLADLAGAPMGVVSPTAVATYGKSFSQHPVGSGPFRLASWTPNESIILDANTEYKPAPPGIARLIFKVVTDNNLRLTNLLTGRVHLIDGILPGDMHRLTQAELVRLIRRPGLNTAYLALNTARPPLTNLKLRQAIATALAREHIARMVSQGMGAPASTLVSPHMTGFPTDLPPLPPANHDKARKLLHEAGYPNGLELTLWCMDIPRPYLPNPAAVAKLIQSNLKAIGIRVRILTHPWSEHLAGTSNGQHDMCLLGLTSENSSPVPFLSYLLSSELASPPRARNKAFIQDAALDRHLLVLRSAPDAQTRKQSIRELELRNRELAGYIPLMHMEHILAASSAISGLTVNTYGYCFFTDVSIIPAKTRP